jgi:hypothetical protein
MREGGGKPLPRRAGNALERPKAHESIGHPGFGPGSVRILAGSKALEPRGIMTYWSSEQ